MPRHQDFIDRHCRARRAHGFADLLKGGAELLPVRTRVLCDLAFHIVGRERIEEVLMEKLRMLQGGGVNFLGTLFADLG